MSPNDDHEPFAANCWLRNFAESRCEASFARIVRHYSGMVFSSAKRRTGDVQLAEECTQDVFLLLARKAGSLHRHPSLTGWIYTTTRWIVHDRMKSEKRRRQKLRRIAEATMTETGESDSREFAFLDEALDELKASDRNVLLWHHFEGVPFSEIAARLRKSEMECRKQASRATGRLHLILRNRGCTVTTASLTAILSSHLCQPASATLLAGIVARSVSTQASIPFFTILQHSLHIMTLTKLQTGIVIAAITLPVGLFLLISDQRQSLSMVAQPPTPPTPTPILPTRELTRSQTTPREANSAQTEVQDQVTASAALPLNDQDIDSFMQAPKAVQGRLLARFRRGEAERLLAWLQRGEAEGLRDPDQAARITELVRESLRPKLEQLESDPDGFADFQTAFVAEILRTDDSAKLEAIHEIIARTYREAVAAGLDSPSRPVDEAAIEEWAKRRDALDRPATLEIQELLSPFERMAFDSAFIGIMGIDLGQGDGLWNRFTTDDESVVFPSEEATP